jgi:hypothetical protein
VSFYIVYGSMLFSAIGKVAAPLMQATHLSLGGQDYPIEYALVPIIGVVVVVYGIAGGIRAAYYTDLIQGLCVILLSVILIPATAKGEAISNIVPMVSHQDIGEHDIDVVVTEHGVADLRGMDDGERADAIVGRCAADAYRGQLAAYLQAARKQVGGHHPQLPEAAFGWYRRLKEEGTMLEDGS